MTMTMFASKSGINAIEVLVSEKIPKTTKARKTRVVITGLFTALLYMLI